MAAEAKAPVAADEVPVHSVAVEAALAQLESSADRGLSDQVAQQRLSTYGPNEVQATQSRGPWRVFFEQFRSVMIWLLGAAAAASIALGEIADFVAIVAMVALTAILGFVQEYRAEQALAALQKLASPTADVVRDGQVRNVPSRDLVPGDIVLLDAGQIVPADSRLIEAVSLRLEEAALTGESEPVDKDARLVLEASTPVADRRNLVYAGTMIADGRGIAMVSQTGPRTEMGRVAGLLATTQREETPLETQLNSLGKKLAAVAIALVCVLAFEGWMRGEQWRLIILTSISVAVAAVPEGLAAAVTVALALGARRMAQRNALVRRLAGVETLGSVTIICSDKTGTLTENRMKVVEVHDTAGNRDMLLLGGALCNNARRSGSEWAGDPTETALTQAADTHFPDLDSLFAGLPRLGEIPFSSDRKRMSTLHAVEKPPECLAQLVAHAGAGPGARLMITKGAADALLERSVRVHTEAGLHPLDEDRRAEIHTRNNDLAARGIRVIGVAIQMVPPNTELTDTLERELVWVGALGLQDPPRPESRAAVDTCSQAGIRPIMITGDHPLTAQAISREVGITTSRTVSGTELAQTPPEQLVTLLDSASVYARVTPEQKLQIVDGLAKQGHITAMTGDGVNDAPALKRSAIGVAMGKRGTDVARQAADIVLLDDNFATIVAAVREGRVIYDNLRKFILFLVTCNSAELWVMLVGPLLGMPLPLLPLQILWMNLVTDGLPALALGIEPAEPNVMRRPPRSPKSGILGEGLGWSVVVLGLLLAIATLSVGYIWWSAGRDTWQTMVFSVLTFGQLALALGLRSIRDSLWTVGFFSNPLLLAAVGFTIALQSVVTFHPFMQRVMDTKPLSWQEMGICGALSLAILAAAELWKVLFRRIFQRV